MATNLSRIEEIERAIGALTSQELAELYDWLEQHHRQPMDARLTADLDSGRLDHSIFEALEAEKRGSTRSL